MDEVAEKTRGADEFAGMAGYRRALTRMQPRPQGGITPAMTMAVDPAYPFARKGQRSRGEDDGRWGIKRLAAAVGSLLLSAVRNGLAVLNVVDRNACRCEFSRRVAHHFAIDKGIDHGQVGHERDGASNGLEEGDFFRVHFAVVVGVGPGKQKRILRKWAGRIGARRPIRLEGRGLQ